MFLILLLTQCGLGKVTDAINRATDVIDRGIEDIQSESANWSTVLQRVAQDLPAEINATIRNEAQNLATRSIATAGVEFRCNVDFLAARAIASLRWLKSKLNGDESAAPPPPQFCQVSPDAIDLNARETSISKVTIHGYDFDHMDQSGKRISFYLLKGDGTREEVPEARIGRTTHYQITINIGELARTLYQDKVTKIISTWDNTSATYPEVVVLPWLRQRRTERVNLERTSFMPPKVGNGDRDFNTHDDEHMSLDARGEISLSDASVLKCRVYMRAREERSDWTEVAGYSPWFVAYSAPAGWRIASFRPNSNSRHTANITTNGELIYSRPAGEVVQRFQVWGDRGGDEAGTWTRMEVQWRTMEVTIEQTIPDWAQ